MVHQKFNMKKHREHSSYLDYPRGTPSTDFSSSSSSPSSFPSPLHLPETTSYALSRIEMLDQFTFKLHVLFQKLTKKVSKLNSRFETLSSTSAFQDSPPKWEQLASQKSLNDFYSHVEVLRSQLKTDSKREDLSRKMLQMDCKLSKEKTKTEELRLKKEELLKQLQSIIREKEQLTCQINKFEQKDKEFFGRCWELEDYWKECETLKDQIDEKQNKLTQEKSNLAESQEIIQELTKELTSIQDSISLKEANLKESKMIFEENEKTNLNTTNKIQQKQCQIQGQEKELLETKELHDKRVRVIQEKEKRIDDLQTELENKFQELQQAKGQTPQNIWKNLRALKKLKVENSKREKELKRKEAKKSKPCDVHFNKKSRISLLK